MSDSESISGSEISDYESISVSETSECERDLLVQRIFGIKSDTIISEKNRNTFIQTVESVTASVTNWSSSITYVCDDLITYDLYKLAIENDNHSIIFIKPHLIKQEEYYNLCLLAVTGNGWTMKYFPKEMQTQELVNAGIKAGTSKAGRKT